MFFFCCSDHTRRISAVGLLSAKTVLIRFTKGEVVSLINKNLVFLSFSLSMSVALGAGAEKKGVLDDTLIVSAYRGAKATLPKGVDTNTRLEFKKIKKEDALAKCKAVSESLSAVRAKCFWGGKLIAKIEGEPSKQKTCGLHRPGATGKDRVAVTSNPVRALSVSSCIEICEKAAFKKGDVCVFDGKVVKQFGAQGVPVSVASNGELESLKKQVVSLSSSQAKLKAQVYDLHKSLTMQIDGLKKELSKIISSSSSVSDEKVRAIARHEAQQATGAFSKMLQKRMIASESRACRAEFKANNPDFRSYDCFPQVHATANGESACLPAARLGQFVEVQSGAVRVLEKVTDAKADSLVLECKALAPNAFGFTRVQVGGK